jgi:predicted nucleotidyltransferase
MENILRQKRKQLGLTQEQAAEACGVSRRTYQTYEETGRINATYDDIYVKLDKLRDSKKLVHSVNSIKKICEPIFKKVPEVECAYLFGSYARGEAKPTSDIDLLIDTNITGLDLLNLIDELRTALYKKIDLLRMCDLQNGNPIILEILKDGIRII